VESCPPSYPTEKNEKAKHKAIIGNLQGVKNLLPVSVSEKDGENMQASNVNRVLV
jgi:hypothetical protein